MARHIYERNRYKYTFNNHDHDRNNGQAENNRKINVKAE